jgi:hypothetical protein
VRLGNSTFTCARALEGASAGVQDKNVPSVGSEGPPYRGNQKVSAVGAYENKKAGSR